MKRRMHFTLLHAAAVGILVHAGDWGLAAFSFCLFVDGTVSK